MANTSTEFSVYIFGEGITEWCYFNMIKQNQLYKFSVEPSLPINSRSCYKKRLALIDKELGKKKAERASLIFLVTDLDNIIASKKDYIEYKNIKQKYKNKGVIFIENYPCIEIWFLEHFLSSYTNKTYTSYNALKQQIKNILPQYDKSKKYYTTNKDFKLNIIECYDKRKKAIENGIKGCCQIGANNGLFNYTEMFKAIYYFRLLNKFFEIKDFLKMKLGKRSNIEPKLIDHLNMTIYLNSQILAIFEYDKFILYIIINNKKYPIDDINKIYCNQNITDMLMTNANQILK